jgi:hypothetical protein
MARWLGPVLHRPAARRGAPRRCRRGLFFTGRGALPFGDQIRSVRELVVRLLGGDLGDDPDGNLGREMSGHRTPDLVPTDRALTGCRRRPDHGPPDQPATVNTPPAQHPATTA